MNGNFPFNRTVFGLINAIIVSFCTVPIGSQIRPVSLPHDSPKKMSLAGAQHKLAVVFRDGALFEPSGHAVSTHILKPNHPLNDDYPHSVINEWFVMRLAARVGLELSATYAGEMRLLQAVNGIVIAEMVRRLA